MKDNLTIIIRIAVILLLAHLNAPNSLAMEDFPDIKGHFFVNGKMLHHNSVKITPNTPTNIEFFFTNPKNNNEVIKDFKIMHGKLAHFLIIKKNLSEFTHIHPYFDPTSGRFQITVNLPSSDPDNFMGKNTFQSGGMYMLMADVIAKGIGMRMFHRHLMVDGHKTMSPLIEDFNINGIYEKSFSHNNANYNGRLEVLKTDSCQGELIDFKFTLKQVIDNQEIDIKSFQPWLAAGAHAVIVSQQSTMMSMGMGHMHSPSPYPPKDSDKGINKIRTSNEPYFIFSFHNKNTLKDGLQKLWIQIKIAHEVITFPFVIHYQNDTLSSGKDCSF